jgi:hypothetical protein
MSLIRNSNQTKQGLDFTGVQKQGFNINGS